ncbi:MAG: WD40/YVTN/BNR-like repeat-containing protein [Chitinophagaceae bacterium]
MKKRLVYIFFYWIAAFPLYSQISVPDDLAAQLVSKTKFYTQKETINSYYTKLLKRAGSDTIATKIINRQLKYWTRYFWFAERHLNTDGEVENVTEKYDEVLSAGIPSNSIERNSFYGDWQPYGPNFVDNGCGRVDRIAFHPTNPNLFYAGTPAGGLWRTTNNGASWQALNQYNPSLGVSGIVVDYSNPNRLFILSGDGDSNLPGYLVNIFGYIRYSTGIYRSDDAGATWYKTAPLPGTSTVVTTNSNYAGYTLKQHPTNPDILYAATTAGLFRTQDGGLSWSRITIFDAGSPVPTAIVWDIEFKPGDPNFIYLSFNYGNGFARSIDGGATFNYSNSGLASVSGYGRIEITVSPAVPNNVYLLAGGSGATPFIGLFVSNNSGGLFGLRSNTPNIFGTQYGTGGPARNQSGYDITLAVNPLNTNQLLMGGISIWRSNDGGSTWTEITDWTYDFLSSNYGDADYVHADIHQIIVNPLNNRFYAACDGGMAWTNDVGNNWVQIHNLQITQFYKIEGVNENGHVWGGAQDNGVIEFDDDESNNIYNYKIFYGGDGYDVLTDVENQNDSYWSVNQFIITDGIGDIDISIPSDFSFFKLLAMHPSNEDIVYAGSGAGLWRSIDGGSNWSLINSNNCSGALSVCPNNANRIYAGNTVLIRSDNILAGAPGITDITPPGLISPTFPVSSWALITGIAVNPVNSSELWVSVAGYGLGKKVYKSPDAGITWQNVSGTLPNLPINCIKMDGGGNVYIGTDIGVYVRNNSMTDWTPFYNGLPRVPVTDIEFRNNPTIGNPEVLIGTFGRGIWRTAPFQSCVPDLILSGTIGGQQFYQAANTIGTSNVIISTLGTNVHYRAGTKITLSTGFNAPSGSTVDLKIAGCTGGVPSSLIPVITSPPVKKN